MIQVNVEEIEKEVTNCVLEAWREERSVTNSVSEIMEIITQALTSQRAELVEEYGIIDDPEMQKEQQEKHDILELAIKNKEVVYLSQFGRVITEEDYLNFQDFVDSVMPSGEGHQRERFTRIDLSTK